MNKKLEEGWQISSCYEAGASGYWLHRQLENWESRIWWWCPRRWVKEARSKRPINAMRELCDALDRYLRGQDKALSVVAVPSLEQEQKRALIRNHRQIMADRGRCEARGKGLLCAQGIRSAWSLVEGQSVARTPTDPRLKDWMKEQLNDWRSKILSTQEKQELAEGIAALAPANPAQRSRGL